MENIKRTFLEHFARHCNVTAWTDDLPETIRGRVGHKPWFVSMLVEAAAKENPNQDWDPNEFLKSYLDRDPVYSNTAAGRAALWFETYLAKEGGDLLKQFVETLVSRDKTVFQVLFYGKVNKSLAETTRVHVDHFMEFKQVLGAGEVNDQGEVSDLTFWECKAVKESAKKNGDPEKGSNVEVTREDYEQVKEAGGLVDQAFRTLFPGRVNEDGFTAQDSNDVTWRLWDGKWMPEHYERVFEDAQDTESMREASDTDDPEYWSSHSGWAYYAKPGSTNSKRTTVKHTKKGSDIAIFTDEMPGQFFTISPSDARKAVKLQPRGKVEGPKLPRKQYPEWTISRDHFRTDMLSLSMRVGPWFMVPVKWLEQVIQGDIPESTEEGDPQPTHEQTDPESIISAFKAWAVRKDGTDDGKTLISVRGRHYEVPYALAEMRQVIEHANTLYHDLPACGDKFIEAALTEFCNDQGVETSQIPEDIQRKLKGGEPLLRIREGAVTFTASQRKEAAEQGIDPDVTQTNESFDASAGAVVNAIRKILPKGTRLLSNDDPVVRNAFKYVVFDDETIVLEGITGRTYMTTLDVLADALTHSQEVLHESSPIAVPVGTGGSGASTETLVDGIKVAVRGGVPKNLKKQFTEAQKLVVSVAHGLNVDTVYMSGDLWNDSANVNAKVGKLDIGFRWDSANSTANEKKARDLKLCSTTVNFYSDARIESFHHEFEGMATAAQVLGSVQGIVLESTDPLTHGQENVDEADLSKAEDALAKSSMSSKIVKKAKKLLSKVVTVMQKNKGKALRGVEVARMLKQTGPGAALPVQAALNALEKAGIVKGQQPDPDEPKRFVLEGLSGTSDLTEETIVVTPANKYIAVSKAYSDAPANVRASLAITRKAGGEDFRARITGTAGKKWFDAMIRKHNLSTTRVPDDKFLESDGVNEKVTPQLYHKSYTKAVQHAADIAKKRGYEVDPESWDDEITYGKGKPSVGKTVRHHVSLLKDGKPQKRKLNIQVYGMDSGNYELNMYIESVDEKVEETPNQVRIRAKNPDGFVSDSFRTKVIDDAKGISIIVGKLKEGDGSMVLQSYRFAKDKGWTKEKAQAWVNKTKKESTDESVSDDPLYDYLQQVLGLGPYTPKATYFICPECGGRHCTVAERHADTGMDEVTGRCPDCGHEGDPGTFKRIES